MLDGHRRGYVINILRGLNPKEAKLHCADCDSISDPTTPYVTRDYVKVCGDRRAELDEWAIREVGSKILPSKTASASDGVPNPTEQVVLAPVWASCRRLRCVRGGVLTGGNHDPVRVPSLHRSPVRARGEVQHAAALVRLPVERDVLASVRVPRERRGALFPVTVRCGMPPSTG